MQRSDECQTEAECFRENSMTTKEDVLSQLRCLRLVFRSKAEKDKKHSASYYKTLDNMLEKMVSRIENTHLFNMLEDWWCYIIDISSDGISLNLQLMSSEYFNDNGEIEPSFIEEEFELIRMDSKLLTVDEYAKQYEVDQGTVRQWIRRGKLRSAVKHGSEWRIPELTEPLNRGYKFGQFRIVGHVDGLPEEYAFINDCSLVNFYQSDNNKKLYCISFDGKKHESIMCDAKERERIELILIASPDAKYISDGLGTYA